MTNKWTPIVPDTFLVPEVLETDQYRIRKLTVNDVKNDYEAVMSSQKNLRGVFGDLMPNWPDENLTYEEDLSNLGWHQTEFSMHTSFAYTVSSLDEKSCIGCVYIFPSRGDDYEVEVYLWVRDSHRNLDSHLYDTVKSWLVESWPFKRIIYPGRI